VNDIPTVTHDAYSGTRYIGQYSGEDSAVLAFIAGKGYTTGPKPLATDRDLWVSIVGDATGAASNAAASEAAAGLSASAASDSAAEAATSVGEIDAAITSAIGDTVQAHSAVLDATTASFTTGLKSKLDGIEANADVTDAANVTAAGALMDSEVANLADVKAFAPADYATATQGGKADSAQQPPAEGAFVDGDKTKLDGIETGANVTDTANVTAAGALMDSEVTNLADVKAFDTSDYATAGQGTKADNALPKAGGTMTGPLVVLDVSETVSALSGATPSLDISAAQVFTLTTSANTTVSITGTTAGKAWVRSIILTMGGAHTFAITSADWGDDAAPEVASGDELKIILDGVGSDFTASVSWRATA